VLERTVDNIAGLRQKPFGVRTGVRVEENMDEDLERYETEVELKLYKEYHDVLPMFDYVVETERRFYLANKVDVEVKEANGSIYFEVVMSDAWVWDMFRPARFLEQVQVLTFRDVNVEKLEKTELKL
jgi:hypothetical protein